VLFRSFEVEGVVIAVGAGRYKCARGD
jgi:hypothetical protein